MKRKRVSYSKTAIRTLGASAARISKLILLLVMFVLGVAAPSVDVYGQQENTRKTKKEVPPQFPPIARQLGLSGTVRVAVVISPEGKVKAAHAVGGPPLFLSAAEEAAKKWEFEPDSKETAQVLEFEFLKPK